MSDSRILHLSWLRFMCGALLVQPLFIPALAAMLEFGRRGDTRPVWLNTARIVLGAFALYGLVAPPLFVRLAKQSAQRMWAKGVDPERYTLLLGMAGGAGPVVGAGVLVIAGDAAKLAYLAAPVSFTIMVVWIWSYRHALRGPSAPTLGSRTS